MSDPSILGAGLSHHHALLAAYTVAMLAWDRVARRLASLWPATAGAAFLRPWREVGFFFLAVAGVLLIGQLYTRDWLLPAQGALGEITDAANQLIIFAPLLVLPLLRRRGIAGQTPDARVVLTTMWLPTRRVWARALVGLVLSLVAMLVFTSVRSGSDAFTAVLPRVYHPDNFSYLVQVFCEDVAIAIGFVRLRAAAGLARAIVLVAVLFAAAHIPALVAGGAAFGELSGLVLDAGLGVLVLFFLQRSADVWWFVWVHFALDMMQFHAGPGAAL
jgi:hypothetical protein